MKTSKSNLLVSFLEPYDSPFQFHVYTGPAIWVDESSFQSAAATAHESLQATSDLQAALTTLIEEVADTAHTKYNRKVLIIGLSCTGVLLVIVIIGVTINVVFNRKRAVEGYREVLEFIVFRRSISEM